MHWETPGHKKSTFLKKFLKKDGEEYPNEENRETPEESHPGVRWKLQRVNPTRFVLDFFTRSHTREEEEELT